MHGDWEDCYRRGETPWDKGAPAPALVEYLARAPVRGSVLVPGCGAGHDVRALAGIGADPLGLDISPSAIRRAEGFERAGNERYLIGDLFALDEALAGSFQWVWEHTCFCAIDPGWRSAYVAAVSRALVPRGRLLGVFYLDPYDEEHRPGEGPPHGCTLGEIDALFGGDFEALEGWVPERTYPGREGREHVMLLEKKPEG